MNGVLFVAMLLIVARLIELQIVNGEEYRKRARHGSDRHIAAGRGEIIALNSRTNEPVILATNTTLDLVYVDPLLVDNPTDVAETLADVLVTNEFDAQCRSGSVTCPRELMKYYAAAFDPLANISQFSSGTLLEPISGTTVLTTPPPSTALPDITEARRLFARDIERRIAQKRVTSVTLQDSATKLQMDAVTKLGIAGIGADRDLKIIWANPEEIPASQLSSAAQQLSQILVQDTERILSLLRPRELRYVPVMRRLPPALSLKIREMKLDSAKETQRQRAQAISPQAADGIVDPYRCIALISEHWRYYPDGTIASQIVGFLNVKQEPQYGIERTFDPQLRGTEGIISMVSDLQGRQIVTSEQTIVSPTDGDTIVLTIDPFIQQNVEQILQEALLRSQSDSAQVIVMDPHTGRILAMANAPLFERNAYSDVYEKEAVYIPPDKEKDIAVEVYHPETNVRIINAYMKDIFTPEGRAALPEKKQEELNEAEQLFDLHDLARYFLYIGQTTRIELFPTSTPHVWLKYSNTIGVGAYLNRAIQTIYEPGSVMKPITMAIAIDQGEVTPDTMYDDTGPVKVDEFTIKNALKTFYGKVSMTDCLAFSINTCMTSVSERLGKNLFHRILERFAFGKITGIELEDELPGDMLPWQDWSNALLATASYGQGVSATPLQVITAFSALVNGGKLMRPTIIDHIEHADGTVERKEPVVLDQVITSQTSETITGMLYQAVEYGYARTAKVPGYKIGGKTGTSQIAGPGGKYEEGTGSTIASFMGFAPVDNPRFIVLVKFDRPKDKLLAQGAAAAGPVFRDIAAFLFKYYGIPPDDR